MRLSTKWRKSLYITCVEFKRRWRFESDRWTYGVLWTTTECRDPAGQVQVTTIEPTYLKLCATYGWSSVKVSSSKQLQQMENAPYINVPKPPTTPWLLFQKHTTTHLRIVHNIVPINNVKTHILIRTHHTSLVFTFWIEHTICFTTPKHSHFKYGAYAFYQLDLYAKRNPITTMHTPLSRIHEFIEQRDLVEHDTALSTI